MAKKRDLRQIFLQAIWKAQNSDGTYIGGLATKKDIARVCADMLNLQKGRDEIREYQINELINEYIGKRLIKKIEDKPLTVKINPDIDEEMGKYAVTTQALLDKIQPNKDGEMRL